MNRALKALLAHMINRGYIGARHLPESRIIISKIKWLSKADKKEFFSQYKEMLNDHYIMRLKKRTGKGSDWHISLNPRRIKEVLDSIQ
jgi:hypothetical protein